MSLAQEIKDSCQIVVCVWGLKATRTRKLAISEGDGKISGMGQPPGCAVIRLLTTSTSMESTVTSLYGKHESGLLTGCDD